MIAKIKQHLGLIIVYLILLIVFYRWFLPGYFVNGDAWLVSQENMRSVFSPYIWKGFHDLGTHCVETPFILINFISKQLSLFFNQNYNNFAIKWLFFYVYLFFAPSGMYLLMLKLTKSKLAATISALIYTLNTSYAVTLAQGHLHLSVPPAFLPWIFWCVINFLESKKASLYLLGGVFFLILSAIYEVRFFYLFMLWLGLLIIFKLLINKFSEWKKIAYLLIVLGLTTIFVNLYWVLPSLLATTSLINNPILNRPSFGSQFMRVLYPMTNLNPYWSSSGIEIFTLQKVPWIFFSFLLMALIGVIVNKKNRFVAFFISLLCIGILITKQTNSPFPFVYSLLFKHLPGFSLFRETSKIFHVVSLSFAILIGYFLSYLELKKKKKQIFLSILILVLCVSYTARPILTGEAKTMFVPINTFDEDYDKLNQFLLQQNKDTFFRVLWLPTASSQGIISNSMPHLHLANENTLWQQTLIRNNFGSITQFSDIITYPEMDELLDQFSVKYVVLSKNSTDMEKSFFYWYEDRDEFKQKIDGVSFLKKVNLDTTKIGIHENMEYDSHLFLSEFGSPISQQNRPWLEIVSANPVHYRLLLHNVSKPVMLQFTETYSDDWKMKNGEVDWFGSLVDKNYYSPNNSHYETDSNLNAFLIDPKVFEANGDSININLYYHPQSYLLLGSFLGLLGIGSVISWLFWNSLKEWKNEK